MEIETSIVQDGSEPLYYEELDALVESNISAYVPWDEYWDEETESAEVAFAQNYRDEHERLIVARVNDSIVGFVTVDIDSRRPDIPAETPFTYLSLILVDEQFRNCGVGTALLSSVGTLLQREDPSNPVVFGTWSSNDAQFYIASKFGFEEYERKKGHRTNGEDSVYFRTTVNEFVERTST